MVASADRRMPPRGVERARRRHRDGSREQSAWLAPPPLRGVVRQRVSGRHGLSTGSVVAGSLHGSQIRPQRLVLSEAAHAEDAEANDAALAVHALHHGVMEGLFLVAGGV